MLSILAAMNDMADAMTAVNASRRQVSGVAAWRDLVAAAVAAGQAAGAENADQITGYAPGSQTHGQWKTTAAAVIATMSSHESEAEEMAREWREFAAEARQDEKRLRDHQAHAEQLGLSLGAAEYAGMADHAAREARRAEDRAARLEDWAVAAADAAARGTALTVREDAVHQPVGLAVADAGGRAWIANDKHFLTGGV